MGYSVIIETNEYAGNFECDVCAFITGIALFGNGSALIQSEFDYSLFSDDNDVIVTADDECNLTPVGIFSENNNSVQIYFNDIPTKEIFELIKIRANIFFKESDTLLIDVYVIETHVVTTNTRISL